MKANTTIPALGALAFVALLTASPAQACMDGGMPFFFSGSGASSCASAKAQAQAQSCPLPGEAAHQGQSCGLINPEMMAAMGDMAAGGMQIATHMMRVLAEEVSRYAAVDGGAK